MVERIDEVKIGQKVKVSFILPSSVPAEIMCDVKWVESDRICLISPNNIEKKLSEELTEGKEIGVLIFTENGIRIFESIIIETYLTGDFVIDYPDKHTYIQRREYVRVPMRLEVILTKDDRRIRTETINISGNGIRFKLNNELQIGEIWNFILYLPGKNEPVRGNGEIIYVVKQECGTYGVIKLINIAESERNKIVKLCFEEEAKRSRYI